MKKIIENKFSKNWIIILVAVAFLVLLIFNVNDKSDSNEYTLPLAMAAESDNIDGYAWSENIGWISFNCIDTDSCATSGYGVGIGTDDKLSGYAWSENIGWISFNEDPDLDNCPYAPCWAELNGTELNGWARALAGKDDPSDGWDGWISLSKQSSDTVDYGVVLDAGTSMFEGYAWGGEVVGWIDFKPNYGGVIFTGETPIILEGTFDVMKTVTGQNPHANWKTEHASSCYLKSDQGYSEIEVCSNESQCSDVTNFEITSSVEVETTYTLTCFNSIGNSVTDENTPYEHFELSATPNKVDIDFVGGSATTTPTSIGVTSYNGFKDNVSFTADLSNLPLSPGEEVSGAIFSYDSLSYLQSSSGIKSVLEIFAAYRFVGEITIPVYGKADGLADESVNVIIDSGDIEPVYEEI